MAASNRRKWIMLGEVIETLVRIAGIALPLSRRTSSVTCGQRARIARTTRLSTGCTPALPWVLPRRKTAVMS